jgi:hypothetical protein
MRFMKNLNKQIALTSYLNDMICNACLHFYPQIEQKEVRAAITLLNSTCIAVLVLTAPTSGYGVFLCIPMEGVKCKIVMYALHILQTSI